MYWIVETIDHIPIKTSVIRTLLIALGVVILASAARAESLQEAQCREALVSFITGDWSTPVPDQCPDDIRLYVGYLATLRADGSDENALKQQSGLLAAADAGNRSAQFLYTLLFTNITDSKFLDEIKSSSYSRYAGYITGMYILPKDPYLTNFIAEPAARDGVVEAYLLLHVASYVEWRNDNWPGYKTSAATDMLIVERFYPNISIKPYLRRLLSLNDAEMQEADRFASMQVGNILMREEVRSCELDKRCAADSNIKRLICDVRTRQGDSLLKLERDVCDRVSASLVRLHRGHIGDIIAEITKPR